MSMTDPELVPTLPQPNEFPKDFCVPKSLSDLVIPSAAKEGQRHPNPKVDLPLFRFLKKVKGCQSLSLQLSWVSVNLFSIFGPHSKQLLTLPV